MSAYEATGNGVVMRKKKAVCFVVDWDGQCDASNVDRLITQRECYIAE